MTSQRNTASVSWRNEQPKREENGTTPKDRDQYLQWKVRANSRRGGCYTSEHTAGVPSLPGMSLKSCVATINPLWTSQNKGEADDLYFSPLFQLWTFPFLPCFSLRASRAGASRAELSDSSNPSLFLFWQITQASPLFLDADAAVETLQNPPEWTEDENIYTSELKPTHFPNFLLYTTDAGRPENNAAHNRAGRNTSSYTQRESGLERNNVL